MAILRLLLTEDMYDPIRLTNCDTALILSGIVWNLGRLAVTLLEIRTPECAQAELAFNKEYNADESVTLSDGLSGVEAALNPTGFIISCATG